MEKIILSKPIVQFTDEILQISGTYFQPGMRAEVVSIKLINEDEDIIQVNFDTSKFEEFNLNFEPLNDDLFDVYYKPKFNEKSGIETLVMKMDEVDKFINLIDGRTLELYDMFCNQDVTESYIEWLEQIILGAADE